MTVMCLRYVGDRPNLQREEVVLQERPRGTGLFLDLGGENWVPLYPFILPTASSDGEVREICFIDAWDTKKGVARIKSFERGGTIFNGEVAAALAKWSDIT